MPEPATTAGDRRVAPLLTMLRLDTRLLLNCLDGVSEELGARRPSADTNSLAYVAAHVVDSRFFLAGVVGLAVDNPLAERLAGARGIAELAHCPPLADSRAAWLTVSAPLVEHLAALGAPSLDRPAAQRLPVDDPSVLGAVAFLAQHEAYHIGQIALVRKFVGLPAMSYAARAEAP